MNLTVQALNVILPMAYLIAAILHAAGFGGKEATSMARSRRAATGLAIAMHFGVFLIHWRSSGASPLFDPWSTLSAVALFLAVLHLVTSMRTAGLGAGAVVLGLVAVVQLLASALGPMEARPATEPTPFVTFVHAITSVAAAGALLLSALHGSLYLIVMYRMKRRKFGHIIRHLPSLHALARMMRRAALAGFLFLGVGINFGIAYAHFAGVEGFGYTDPWVLVMLILWLHFGAVAFSGIIPGFSAQRASGAAAIGGFILLASTIVAVLPAASFHWRL